MPQAHSAPVLVTASVWSRPARRDRGDGAQPGHLRGCRAVLRVPRPVAPLEPSPQVQTMPPTSATRCSRPPVTSTSPGTAPNAVRLAVVASTSWPSARSPVVYSMSPMCARLLEAVTRGDRRIEERDRCHRPGEAGAGAPLGGHRGQSDVTPRDRVGVRGTWSRLRARMPVYKTIRFILKTRRFHFR
jgi:hypothetical protein